MSNKEERKITRLTVLYNLKEGADEEEFIRWRLQNHQQTIKSLAGVFRTDFARITDNCGNTKIPAYHFITTLDWPDRKSFETSFYDEQVQADLKKNMEKLGDYQFLISELLI